MKKQQMTLRFLFFFGMLAMATSAWCSDNGTITINGMVWLKDAACLGKLSWNSATSAANNLSAANAPAACNLKDGSTAGQWRLPTYSELYNIRYSSNLFSNVQKDYYWSSSKSVLDGYYNVLNMANGKAGAHPAGTLYNFWPVRNP